jgi:ABC-2 type transport system permease protein
MRLPRILAVLILRNVRILSRSRATLLVIFLPGIVLYTIFTNIFSGPAGAARPFRVAVIDEDRSTVSRQLIESLTATRMIVQETENGEPDGPPLTLDRAMEAIRRRGNYRIAVVIPQGYHTAPNMIAGPTHHKGLVMYYDALEPVEAEIAGGLIQMAAGRQLFDTMRGLSGNRDAATQPEQNALVKIERHDVRVTRMKNVAKHTFLAGIVPMFLLFSAAGAARSLLESIGTGEMRRLLAAPVAPAHILLGEMLYILLIQLVQCYVMYFYAWLVFGVAIWQITGGLFVLTLCTGLATTAFGMFLGALCRTAEQLDAVGTMVILAMSAVGGSMVPRHVMPEWMQKFGLLTINGWSFDGFMSVLAFEGWSGLAPSCGVLVGVAVLCAGIGSRLLARRLRG